MCGGSVVKWITNPVKEVADVATNTVQSALGLKPPKPPKPPEMPQLESMKPGEQAGSPELMKKAMRLATIGRGVPGRRNTILTGPRGVTQRANTSKPMLLGNKPGG